MLICSLLKRLLVQFFKVWTLETNKFQEMGIPYFFIFTQEEAKNTLKFLMKVNLLDSTEILVAVWKYQASGITSTFEPTQEVRIQFVRESKTLKRIPDSHILLFLNTQSSIS